METAEPRPAASAATLELRLFGPVTVLRDGRPLPLPASRKVRALLVYLALASRPVPRAQLCDLLWDEPDDPRGELRWCLSKLRKLLDEPGRTRVRSSGAGVQLELADVAVDALEFARASREGFDTLDVQDLAALHARCAGDLAAGLEIERSPEFTAWLGGERRRFLGRETALLERLVADPGTADALRWLERWLQLAPFDARVHERLLATLAQHGRHVEADAHVAATVRRFEAEGIDAAGVRAAWRRIRAGTPPTARAASPVALAPSPVTLAPALDRPALLLPDAAPGRRASVVVMPFADASGDRGGHADGLAHDVITRLAKLRSVFVIAQGTAFALRERSVRPDDAARTLDVDYVVTGTVRPRADRLLVDVALTDARTGRIAWAETFEQPLAAALEVLDGICDRVVASIAAEIETAERNRAVLKPPNSLDAWEALHRGLWHMYRFAREDNTRARGFFDLAVRLDPTFARAHAALSFTHWQSAFQGWGDVAAETEQAYATAGRSLMADDRDPAAHYAMGRALWLRGAQEPSLAELQRAVELSPNFALGHYAVAFVQSQTGDPAAAVAAADRSYALSPFDPLLFGMFGARAMALARLERFDEAAAWASKAAARPNAHVHIRALAALTLSLAGSLDEARRQLAALHAVAPDYGLDEFLRTFRFDADGKALYTHAATRLAMPP